MDLYGLNWSNEYSEFDIEQKMLRLGGYKTVSGTQYGNGYAWHFRRFQQILFQSRLMAAGGIRNHWADELTRLWQENSYIGVMGCAAAGKSNSFAANALADWYIWPEKTTTLISSTTKDLLKLRIWSMIVSYHQEAKKHWPDCPGHLIAGDLRIVYKEHEDQIGADFRNGIVGLACRVGNEWVGLSSYVGIHNERVRVIFDEAHMMPRAVIDSTSNLSKCPDFKCVALGNPNETTNAHGLLCEPAPELGGWESGKDQQPGTKTWKTRFPGGVAIQLPGSDSPNHRLPEGSLPAFPTLMTRQQMLEDAKIWGCDDWHYLMMNEARMPRGQGSRRFLTRQFCLKNQALLEPHWLGTPREKVAFLDSAFGGVGGDRCVFGQMEFGSEAETVALKASNGMLGIPIPPPRRQLLSLVDLVIVPVQAGEKSDPPEEQIARWVKTECERRDISPQAFFFDAGMRAGLVTSFSRIWSPAVSAVDFGGPATDRMVGGNINKPASDLYFNFVTELWWRWRLVIEYGQFRGLTESAMLEGCQREWMTVRSNRVQAEPKEEMKKKTGKSPDLADAICIGVEGAFRLGFQLAPRSADQTGERDFGWIRDLARKQAEYRRSREFELSPAQ